MLTKDIWNDYIQESIIDSGEFSFVYKAKNKRNGNYVAIKEINKEKYKQFTKLNFNDKEIMQNLNSGENVLLKDIMNNDKYFYVITDLCLCNMEEYLNMRKDNLTIEEIREILNKLNYNLKTMNNKNIVYRHFKPKNILINLEKINKCNIKLYDYDTFNLISKNIEETYLTLAPEILKSGKFSSKSDIWSLGILIYYLCFKEYPFNGKNKVIVYNEIISGKKLKLIGDKDLDDLMNKMLKIDINQRISWEDYFNHSFFHQTNEIYFPLFNFQCKLHNNNEFYYYCYDCKSNLCDDCIKEHKFHKIISFIDIGLNELEMNQINNLNKQIENNLNNLYKLKDDINWLLNRMKLKKENTSIFGNDIQNNYKKYYIDCFNVINNKLKIKENINIITLKESYILCAYDFQKIKDEESIQILNCFEGFKKEFPNTNGEENEKEISEGYELLINEKKIDFCFKYKFPKDKKDIIKIKSKSPLTNISCMFYNCSSLISLNFSNFNTYSIINMNGLFYNCTSITSLNLSNFNTKNVTNMRCMFFNCSSLNSLNLSNFNTNNVTDMGRMFDTCSSLTSLDLSNFNTNNVKDMNGMFYNCSSLKSLNLYNFNTNNVLDMGGMFYNCFSLTSLNLYNFNFNKVINMNYLFKGLNKNCKIISNSQYILNKLD